MSRDPEPAARGLPREDVARWERYAPLPLPVVHQRDHAGYLAAARSLAATPDSTLPRYARDRPVGALLVSPDGEPLMAARNAGALSRALHAEVNLAQCWHRASGRPIPRGARIYVTLKCCRMCAALIWQCAEDVRALEVYYGEDDPGPNARATALDRGNFDRARFARGDRELERLELQFGPFG